MCRQAAGDRVMLGCDGCDEWFHTECIGLDETEAEAMESYLCAKCCQRRGDVHPKRKAEDQGPSRSGAAKDPRVDPPAGYGSSGPYVVVATPMGFMHMPAAAAAAYGYPAMQMSPVATEAFEEAAATLLTMMSNGHRRS